MEEKQHELSDWTQNTHPTTLVGDAGSDRLAAPRIVHGNLGFLCEYTIQRTRIDAKGNEELRGELWRRNLSYNIRCPRETTSGQEWHQKWRTTTWKRDKIGYFGVNQRSLRTRYAAKAACLQQWYHPNLRFALRDLCSNSNGKRYSTSGALVSDDFETQKGPYQTRRGHIKSNFE